MKVGHHVTLVVLVATFGGLLAISLLLRLSDDLRAAQARDHGVYQAQSELIQVRNMTRQWLLTIDLFFGHEQVFLAEGISHQSDDIRRVLGASNHAWTHTAKERINTCLRRVQQQIKIAEHAPNETSTEWQSAMIEIDHATAELAFDLDQLDEQLGTRQKLALNHLHESSERFDKWLRNILLIYLSALITTWFWSWKALVGPIQHLTQLAKRGDVRSLAREFKGPQEIKTLAHALKEFADIVEQERQRAECKQSEATELAESMTRLMQAVPDAVICCNSNGDIIEANAASARIFGYKKRQQPIHLTKLIPNHETITNQATSCFQSVGTKINGQHFPIEISTSSKTDMDPQLRVFSIRDITKREMMNERLSRAEKLKTIGELAAGITHEINSPAQYVRTNLSFLKEAFDDLAPALSQLEIARSAPSTDEAQDIAFLCTEIPEAVNEAIDGIDRIDAIIQSVRIFSHPGATAEEQFNINECIQAAVKILGHEWKHSAAIEVNLASDLPLISGFSNRLSQIILNLLTNAIDAIRERADAANPSYKGVVAVTTQVNEATDQLEIVVKDNGSGIPTDICDNLFKPFFTTKKPGKGSGQGMAIIRDILQNDFNGTISFQTEVNAGTAFTLAIPLAPTAKAPT